MRNELLSLESQKAKAEIKLELANKEIARQEKSINSYVNRIKVLEKALDESIEITRASISASQNLIAISSDRKYHTYNNLLN